MKQKSSPRTLRAAAQIGEHVHLWRKLQGLSAEVVCQRAGISRPALRKLEYGDPTVTLETFLNVARALGRLDSIAHALDPYDTDLGRARADIIVTGTQTGPKKTNSGSAGRFG